MSKRLIMRFITVVLLALIVTTTGLVTEAGAATFNYQITQYDPKNVKQLYTGDYVNGSFVVGGASANYSSSANGDSWQAINTSGLNSWETIRDISYADGKYIMAESGRGIYSNNGTSWADLGNIINYPQPPNYGGGSIDVYYNAADYLNGNYFLSGAVQERFMPGFPGPDPNDPPMGGGGTDQSWRWVVYSADGSNWIPWIEENTFEFDNQMQGVAYGNGVYVAVGMQGKIYSSDNLGSATERNSGTTQNLNDVIFANNLFVTIGQGGNIRTSGDGTSWTSQTSGTAHALNKITWDGNFFITAGDAGTVLYSSDGTTWNAMNTGIVDNLVDIAANGSDKVFLTGNAIVEGTYVTPKVWLLSSTLGDSDDNRLQMLKYNSTIAPNFAHNKTSYNVNVPNTMSSITITPYRAENNATIKVNGNAAISGQPTDDINLAIGTNTIPVEVTPQSGSPRTYTITINRTGISPATANFYKESPADVITTMTLNGNSLTSIKKGDVTLTANTDYTVNSSIVTIKNEYLANQANGDTVLTFYLNGGDAPTLTITISDSMPNQNQEAPTGLAGVAPTAALNDGKITGTTTAMEYKLASANDSEYAPCSDNETTGFSAGDYVVRYAGKTGFNASTATAVTVPASPAYLATASAASAAPTAGANNSITLTVKDSQGNTDTNFSGAKDVTIAGAAAAPDGSYGSFNDTALTSDSVTNGQTIGVNFTNGTVTANLALNKAAAQTIAFSIAGVATPATNTLTITPVVGAAASMAVTTGITAPAENGGQFAQQPVVTLKDAYGNTAAGDNSTQVTASKKDAGAWTLTGTATRTAVNGVVTFTGLGATNAATVTNAQLAFSATGLTEATSVTVTLPAPVAHESTITQPEAPSNEGGIGGGSSTPAGGVEVLVNGIAETAGTLTTISESGRTVSTVTVDPQKIAQKLETEGNNSIVTVPVYTNSDVVAGELNGQTVKNMENKQSVLEIKTGMASYTLPAEQINIDALSGQIGQNIKLENIKVKIEIARSTEETAKVVENSAKKGEFTVVAPPVDFKVTVTGEGKTVDVSRFNIYVERTIAIPEGVDPSKITTGVVLNSDGTVSHVPTKVVVIDGKYYAQINSLTNSTYSVIWHPKTFNDVENHWAKNYANEMGSRMVINGVDENNFAPNREITRAEYAAITVRALGLMENGKTNEFKDVQESD